MVSYKTNLHNLSFSWTCDRLATFKFKRAEYFCLCPKSDRVVAQDLRQLMFQAQLQKMEVLKHKRLKQHVFPSELLGGQCEPTVVKHSCNDAFFNCQLDMSKIWTYKCCCCCIFKRRIQQVAVRNVCKKIHTCIHRLILTTYFQAAIREYQRWCWSWVSVNIENISLNAHVMLSWKKQTLTCWDPSQPLP